MKITPQTMSSETLKGITSLWGKIYFSKQQFTETHIPQEFGILILFCELRWWFTNTEHRKS